MAEKEPHNLENNREKLGKELLNAFDALAEDAKQRAGLPLDTEWDHMSFEKVSSFEGLRSSEELQIGFGYDNYYVTHEVQLGRPDEQLHENSVSISINKDGILEDDTAEDYEEMPPENFITLMQGFRGSRAVIEISAPAEK